MLVVRINDIKDYESKKDVLDNISRDFLNRGVENGFVRIFSYPSIDAVFASVLMLQGLQRLGLKVALTVSLEIPRNIQEPHVVVGYSDSKITENKGDSMRLCVSRKILEPPTPNSFCIEFNSSYGISMVSIMQSTGIFSNEAFHLALLSPYLSSKGFKPEFTEIEKAFIDDVVSRSGSESVSKREEILLHGVDMYPLVDSIYFTLEPFIPGLTGSRSNIIDELRIRELDKYALKYAKEIESKFMAEVLKLISSKIEDYSKKKRDVRDYIGELIISDVFGTDLATVKRLLNLMISFEGNFNPVFRLVMDPANFIDNASQLHEALVKEYSVVEMIKNSLVKFERSRKYPWLNLYIVRNVPRHLLHIIGYNLRFLGFLEEDSLVATVTEDRKMITTIPEIEYTHGSSVLKRIKAQMIGEIEDATVILENA